MRELAVAFREVAGSMTTIQVFREIIIAAENNNEKVSQCSTLTFEQSSPWARGVENIQGRWCDLVAKP